MSSDSVAAVIPARYASTRFPGKVLAPLAGKPVIQHVWERTRLANADRVLVAADHPLVLETVRKFGGEAVLTDPDLPSGTDRICAALRGIDAEIVINVQGDEPLIPPEVISELIAAMKRHPEFGMGTVAVPGDRAALADPNRVKVVFGDDRRALYFSRSVIPYLRTGGVDTPVYLHWGIYAYRRRVLEEFVKWPQGRLEQCEKLEQLRALEHGVGIYVLLSDRQTVGIDTPEDLAAAEKWFRR